MAITPKVFRAEAERRLIDTFDLMLLLGLRSRQGIHDRVRTGKLPAPVFTRTNSVALWDRDEIPTPDKKEG